MSAHDEQPPTYHACTRAERDHLLAAAMLQDQETPPSGKDIQRKVEHLRMTERPTNTTTYTVLDLLTEYGWLDCSAQDGKTNGYRLTDGGRSILVSARVQFPE